MTYMIIDLETSIADNIHGPSGVYPKNDFYSFIYKRPDEEVQVLHNKNGFKRRLPVSLDGVKVIIGHNIKFDLLYFWADKEFQDFLLRGGYVYDTQLGEYLLTGQRHKMSSLAELQEKYLGEIDKPNQISKLFKKGIGADQILKKDNIPLIHSTYNHYCRSDGIMTERVFLKQYQKIKTSGMWPIVKMYNHYLLALIMMEHNGMPFDLNKVESKSREYNLASLEYLKQIRELIDPIWSDRLPEFNPGSGDHLSWILYGGTATISEREQQGYYKNGNPKFRKVDVQIDIKGFGIKKSDNLKAKKAGIYKADKTVLSKIAETDNKAGKLASLILEMRALTKLASTYFPSYIERQIYGCVHPTYRNTQTITGRLSCTNPNFQNIPKGGEVESLISPLDDGWSCVQIDYSQLEVYILAYSSTCSKLIDDILNGKDQHCQSLSYATDKSYEEVKELVSESEEWANKRKKIGKPITFGIQYGASAGTISKNAGLTVKEAEQVLNRYYEEYPEIKDFFDMIRDSIENDRHLCYEQDVNSLERKQTKNGRRFNDMGQELLPLKDWDTGDNTYMQSFKRHVGYFKSLTGRLYSYESDGSLDSRGEPREVFRQPIIQNYAIQGTAGDVQCASSVSMFQSLLRHTDKIRLINEIHDSKWFLIKTKYLDALLPKVVWHMEHGFKEKMKEILGIEFPASLKVDVEVGPNFAELKPYEVDRC